MTKRRELGNVLDRAVIRAILVATVSSTGACGGASETSGADTGETTGEPLDCAASGGFDLSTMTLSAEHDYIARLTLWDGNSAPNEEPLLGTCDETCIAAVSLQLPDEDSELTQCEQICSQGALVTYDEATAQAVRLQSVDKIKALLGTIDSADEATFLAHITGADVSCSRTTAEQTANGFELTTLSSVNLCPPTDARVVIEVTTDGDVNELSREELPTDRPDECAVAGRRPEGLYEKREHSARGVGPYLAKMAHLEDAAVSAFRIIVDELRTLGAPHEFSERAQQAVRDEEKHTQQMTSLAIRFGHAPQRAVVESRDLRGLYDFALDNAVEGCIRETLGAAQARHQARQAEDCEIRRIMSEVAEDETRHAELSWDLHDWALRLLSENQRATILKAQRAALSELKLEAAAEFDVETQRICGVPHAKVTLEMIRALEENLWSPALAA